MLAAFGLVPALLAKSGTAAGGTAGVAPVTLRPEQRAVPRREGSC
jgi:hypothetical protein